MTPPRKLKKAITRFLSGNPNKLVAMVLEQWRELSALRPLATLYPKSQAGNATLSSMNTGLCMVMTKLERALADKDRELTSRREQVSKYIAEIERLDGLLKATRPVLESGETLAWEKPLHQQNWLPKDKTFDAKRFRDVKEKEGADHRKGHTQIACKCGHCGLHFMLFTWWTMRWANKKPHCPECGNEAEYIYLRPSRLEIFQVFGVKGRTVPTEDTASRVRGLLEMIQASQDLMSQQAVRDKME